MILYRIILKTRNTIIKKFTANCLENTFLWDFLSKTFLFNDRVYSDVMTRYKFKKINCLTSDTCKTFGTNTTGGVC